MSALIDLMEKALKGNTVTEAEISSALDDTDGLYRLLLQFTNLLYAMMVNLRHLQIHNPQGRVDPIVVIYYEVFIALCKALERGDAPTLSRALVEIDAANHTPPRYPVEKNRIIV